MANSGISLVLRETVKGRNSTQGDYIEYTYEGTEDAVIGGESEAWQNGAIDTRRITAAGEGAHRLVVRYNKDPGDPEAEVPSVEFRMDPGRTNISPLQPPYVGVDNISTANLAEIRRALDENDTALVLDGGASEALAQDLYLIMLRGEEFRTVYRPTFTLVRTASSFYIWPDQGGSVGEIYLRATVISEVQSIAGSTPNFTLPQDTFTNSGAPLWNYGWLKHAPNYDTTVGNRTTESIDWEYGLWPESIYGVPS